MPKSKNKNKKRKTSHNYSATDELSHAEVWDDSALLRSWDDALAEYEYYHSIHARGENVDEVLRQAELDEEKQAAAVRALNPVSHENDVNAGLSAGSEDGEVDTDDDKTAETSAATANPVQMSRNTMTSHVPSYLDGSGDGNEHGARQVEQRLGTGGHASHHGPYLPGAKSPGSEDRSRMPSIVVDEDDPPPMGVASSARGQIPDFKALPLPVDQTLENIKMAYYWAGYYSGLYDGQQQAQQQVPSQAQTSGQKDVPAHKGAN